MVRQVPGAAATKTYRCPGCDQEIRPGVAHVVVWPEQADRAEGRRHWHNSCWQRRPRRPGPWPTTYSAEEPMTEIRASTVLPARREPITLRTADGLSLVGELAAARGPPAGRHARLPAPAAHRRAG